MARRILSTDLAIWPVLQNIQTVSDAMLQSDLTWSRLATQLLLYDQIVIPTGNLQVLPVLRLILGEPVFEDLVRRKVLVFAKYNAWIGYAGGGGGLVVWGTTGEHRDGPKPPNMFTAFFLPLEQSIDIALSFTNPPTDASRRRQLKELLIDNTIVLPWGDITGKIKDEVRQDIVDSPYLVDMLGVGSGSRNIDHLGNTSANTITVFSPHIRREVSDSVAVWSLLRVAFENLVLGIGGHAQATDVSGSDDTVDVLRAKGRRFGFSERDARAFASIQDVSNVPDLGHAFASKRLTPVELVKLRESKHCQALRDWLGRLPSRANAEEVLRAFQETVMSGGWIDRLPTRILRFAVTSIWGAVAPVSGLLASAVDSFALSAWFPLRSPRVFLKQAGSLLAAKNPPPPAASKLAPNAPCYCGSGRKYKKCCRL